MTKRLGLLNWKYRYDDLGFITAFLPLSPNRQQYDEEGHDTDPIIVPVVLNFHGGFNFSVGLFRLL
jgi:hypothetical protein